MGLQLFASGCSTAPPNIARMIGCALWPEVDYEMSSDDTVRLYPAWDIDYPPNLPAYRCDARTGDCMINEERYEDLCLEALSWRVAEGETGILKVAGTSFGDVHGFAIAIAGGNEPPRERIVSPSLNEI